MGKLRFLPVGVGAAAFVGVLGLLLNCAKDPRDGEAVTVISACNLDALDSRPTSPESSLKAYVQASADLAKASADVSAQLTATCNRMATDLGLPTGNDPVSACQGVSTRAKKVAGFKFAFPPSCKTDPTALATCIATCAAGCDVTKCEEGKLQGQCAGTCKGNCVQPGKDTTCSGGCAGACGNFRNNSCGGECIGTCGARTYNAACETGCAGPPFAAVFTGVCGGTCTGTCDGAPVNGGIPDAGAPQDAGGIPDSGADGAADGGAPPADAGPITWPPTGADGNCKGICAGVCSSKAAGRCGAPCAGAYSAGACAGGPCNGQCVAAAGNGCTPIGDGGATTCDGICTTKSPDTGATCTGVCQGSCDQPFTNPTCTGKLNCGQNVQCENACNTHAGVSIQCAPPDVVEVQAPSDPALYAEFKKEGPALAAALQTLNALRAASAFIAQQTPADFATIGATGDLVRACIAQGNASVDQANKSLQAAANGNPNK